jgi:hypothetical protein
MADSTSPEPQDAAAPSALTSSSALVRRMPAPGRRPLPDAVAIHLVVVPDGAPPYDDAPPAIRKHQPATSDAADVSRAITAMADASRTSAGGPGQGQFAGHWPSQFAQALAETLAGSRPPSQLARWTTLQTRRRISQLGPLMSTAHRPRVKRVVITSPTGGVLEMAVVVGVGTRVRALAIRLERTQTAMAGDTAEGRAADVQPADQHGPQAAVRHRRSARHSPPDHPGWICTAIEAA